jgi:2-methylcitrate dehydratase PrpD
MNKDLAISNFIRGTRFAELPVPVIHQAKRCFLDTVGCILAGIVTRFGKSLIELSSLFLQPGGASILGVRRGVSPLIATMANGFLANALDADDGHRTAKGHPGGVIIPAALAAAELKDCDGKTFIEALVVGYEIGLRAGWDVNSGETYWGSAHWATFGAASCAAKIFDLQVGAEIHALGISEMFTPTCHLMGWIEAREIPMIKEGMGWAAATGLISAMLAEKQTTGTLTLFKHREEIARISSLGSDFEILKVYFKQYPSCRWTHSVIDNFMASVTENHLNPDDISSVRVITFKQGAFLDMMEPRTIEEAQYSIPFLLGAAIVEGSLGPPQMNEKMLTNKVILDIARKVHISVDPELQDKFPGAALSKVELETHQGKSYSKSTDKVKGDWDVPLTDQEVKEKFFSFSSSRLSASQSEKVIEVIDNLEDIKRMRDFFELFS